MSMTAKQYLNQIQRTDLMVSNKLADIYNLRVMVTSITVKPKDVNVQTSGDKDKLGSMVSRIIDMEHEVDSLIDERAKIISEIDSMENTEYYDILAKRYILGKDLKVIAIDKGISFRHINRLHGEALQAFEKQFGKEFE